METPEKQIVQVTIEGVAPIIFNNPSSYLNNKNTVSKKVKKVYNDEEEIKARLYTTDKGVLYQPAEHIEKALQKAGREFKYDGRRSYLEFIKSGVFVMPDCIPHLLTDITIWHHSEIVGTARVPKAFPMLKEWKLSFNIEIINPNITPKDLNDILTHAGKFNGLGEKRPRWGRFIVTEYKYNGQKSSY